MDEMQIEQFLNRPTLKRLDDQAREELRAALRERASMRLSYDVNFEMANLEKDHRDFSESVMKPVLKNFQDRKNQIHKQGLGHPIDHIADHVRSYSVVFSVGFTLVGVCAILIAVWLKLSGNDWSREYLGAGFSFLVTALLQYLPWRLAGKLCSKTKKILSLFAWVLVGLIGIVLHMVTRG